MTRRQTGLIAAPLLVLSLSGALVGGARSDKQSGTYTIPLPPKPDFSPLGWLMGDWAGHTMAKSSQSKGAQGEVHLTLSYALDQRFVLMKEELSLPAGTAAPAVHETWTGLLTVTPSAGQYRLQAYSSTGFITAYRLTSEPGELRFDPEGGPNPPPGWLFRRRITRAGEGVIDYHVEVAPPGGAFFEYYSAELTTVTETKSTNSPPATAK